MNTKMLKPTILSVSLLTIMASAAISPALPKIAQAFPDIDKTFIRLILTLPSLIVIPFSLISGGLVAKFSKKAVLLAGLIIYMIGGAGGGLAQNVPQLLIMRAILGVGVGLIMPLSTALIFDFFEGDARNKMMGLQMSANQLGGVVFLSIAGWLAISSWRYAFGVYLLAIVTLLFILFWLPQAPEKEEKKKVNVKLPLAIFGLAAIAAGMMIVFYVVATDIALFIQEERPMFSHTSSTALFQNKEEFAEHLAKGTLSETTYNAFEEQGISLSEDATLRELEPKQEWQILDGMKEYTVRKTEGKLVIYSGIGTPALAGYALSVLTLTGVIAGMILSKILKTFKTLTAPFGCMLMGFGYGVLVYAQNIWGVFGAMILIGFGCAFMSPPIMLQVPKVVTPKARALALAVISSSLLFGQFLSPLFMKLVVTLAGRDTFRFRFGFLAVLLIIASPIATMLISMKRKQTQPTVTA